MSERISVSLATIEAIELRVGQILGSDELTWHIRSNR